MVQPDRSVQAVVSRYAGCEAFDRHGTRIGRVTGLWLSERDEPAFAAVTIGAKAQDTRAVPLEGSNLFGKTVLLRHSAAAIRESPSFPVSTPPTTAHVEALLHHYTTFEAPRVTAPSRPVARELPARLAHAVVHARRAQPA